MACGSDAGFGKAADVKGGGERHGRSEFLETWYGVDACIAVACEGQEGLTSVLVSYQAGSVAEEGVERFVSSFGGCWAGDVD